MTSAGTELVVYIIDDDAAVLDSLDVFLTTAGLRVNTFSDPQQFLASYDAGFTGCLVVDIRMPSISGLGLQEELIAIGSTLPIIFITGHGDVRTAVNAMKAGAFEFMEKPFSQQLLLDHIRRAFELNTQRRQTFDRQQILRDRVESLTPREKEVLGHMVNGKATKVIAIELGLSHRTVDIYRANIMQKMQSKSIAQLVKTLSEHGSHMSKA